MISIKEKILKILDDHPEGLLIQDISKYIGKSRYIVTKWLYELRGEGRIQIRELSKAKLVYSRRK